MEFRNSSPPPEFDEDMLSVEMVGGTVYKKLFVIDLVKRILSKLVIYCSNNEDINCVDDDLDFDDDLCKLMDITVEPEVLDYIKNFAYFEPFCDAICVNKSERFNELFIGILSNFASNEDLCDRISSNPEIIQLLLSFWSSSSSPFLLECIRLLKIVLKTTKKLSLWLNSIKSHSELISNIIFILKSSTNNELLISTVQILGQLMKLDEEICDKWISEDLLEALLTARNEANWFSDHDIDYFHYVIHLYSTSESGIVSLINNFGQVYSSMSEYIDLLNHSDEEPPHLLMLTQHHNSLRLILPTLEVTISNMAPLDALESIQQCDTIDGSDLEQESRSGSLLENLVKLVYACTLQTITENSLIQKIYLEISSFFNTIINITHIVITDPEFLEPKKIKWLQSIDVGACLPQLEAFLLCCTKNESAKQKMIDISTKLNLTYLQEALYDVKIK